MIPFKVNLQSGVSIYEQVVYAAKKALISGAMSAGEPFPSVRTLSKALKINPNTAHKVITALISEGLIEVHPGLGTVVADKIPSTANERAHLLKNEVEHLVVEAIKLGLSLDEITTAISSHWNRLEGTLRSSRRR